MRWLIPFGIICWIVFTMLSGAAEPSWWEDLDTEIIHLQAEENSEFPVTLGQLKYTAIQAKKHLDKYLPGGAGEELEQRVKSFEPRTGQEYTEQEIQTFLKQDEQQVNRGRLTLVAKPFYDRMMEEGFPEEKNPVDQTLAMEKNQMPATIADLKRFFGFSLDKDEDNNGLVDWWEEGYFKGTGQSPDEDADGDGLTNLEEFQQRSDPSDYYHQGEVRITPRIRILGGNEQIGVLQTPLLEALRVDVRDASNENILPNAPVLFSIETGAGAFYLNDESWPLHDKYVVRTNQEGVAEVFLYPRIKGEKQNGEHVLKVRPENQKGKRGKRGKGKMFSDEVTFVSFVLEKSGLTAHWQLEEENEMKRTDLGPFKLDGECINSPQRISRLTNDFALAFDGGKDEGGRSAYVKVMGQKKFAPLDFGQNSFTVTLWFRGIRGGGGGVLFAKGGVVGAPGYYLALTTDGKLEFSIGSDFYESPSEMIQVRSQKRFDDEQWHHVAVVVDQSEKTLRLVVDEIAVTLEKVEGSGGGIGDGPYLDFQMLKHLAAGAPGEHFYLGCRNGESAFLMGALDDIRVFRKALNNTQIVSLIHQSSELMVSSITYTIDEDTAGHWELQHTGGGHGMAEYRILTPTANGDLVLKDEKVTYYPNAHYNGKDRFVFSVTKNGTTEEALVNIVINPDNDPPLVYAGPNQNIVLPAHASLQGSLMDIDTELDEIETSWSKEEGPGNVVFSSPETLGTTAEFDAPGNYVLVLRARDSAWRSDSIRVMVLPENTTDLPVVRMVSPENRKYYDLHTTLHLKVSAQTAEGATIEKVEFYEGSRKIGEVLVPNSVSGYYEMDWTPERLGGYSLSAIVWDSEKRTNVSSRALVMIKYKGWFSGGEFASGNEGYSGIGGNGGASVGHRVGPGSEFFDEKNSQNSQ